MRPSSIFKWLKARKESAHLALVAECANLVIQQHAHAWTSAKCSHCQLPISEIGNYCPWCGTSFIPPPPPQEPVEPVAPPVMPVFSSYEIPDRHTSGYRLDVPPKRTIPLAGARAANANADTHQITVSPAMQAIIRKKQRIDDIVDRQMKATNSNGGK